MKTQSVSNLMIAGLALLLAGCGSQQASQVKDSSSSNSSSLLVAKSNEKVSTDNLSPQQAVSLIATYAGNKYGDDWATMAKKAQKQGLQVNLYPTSKYKLSDNGQGVAYDVTAGGKSTGLVYTIKKDNTVNIQQNVKSGKLSHKLATISKQDMASYVNRQGQAKLVGDLAKNAQVIDKQSGSQSSSTSSSESTGHQYGRQEAVTVPAEMQGTWYSSDYDSNSKITFSKNAILGEDGQQYHLYKQDPNFLAGDTPSTSVQNATRYWSSARFVDVHGLHFLNVRGWCQTAGDGSSYAIHTETVNGKQVKVLVVAEGAGYWTSGVYYQNPQLAKQQADKKFDDLHYMEDDD